MLVKDSISVAGLSKSQDVVVKFAQGGSQDIVLEREPDNPIDKNAIMVMAKWTDENREVHIEPGWL